MSKKAQKVENHPAHSPFTPVALAWATFICILYFKYTFSNIPIPLSRYFQMIFSELALGPTLFEFWLKHLLRSAAAFSFFLGAWAVGKYALSRFLRQEEGREKLGPLIPIFSLGLGLGIYAYLAFAIIVLGIVSASLLICLYVVVCIFGYVQAWRFFAGYKKPAAQIAAPPLSKLEKISFILLLVGLILAFLGTTIPEISYDALVYHLGVPQMFLYAGHMIDMPYNHFSYLPLLTSMLYFWGLVVGDVFMAKLINFLLGLSILWGIYSWGKMLKNRELGLMACAIFIGTPLVLYLFWMVNSDFGVAFFLLLGLMSFWYWLEDHSASNQLLYLSGIYGGFALACKYTAIFGVAALAFLYAVAVWRKRKSIQLFPIFLYGVLLLLPLTPWWARNYIYTGNPFYPYLTEQLGGKNGDADLLRAWRQETKDISPGFRPDKHLQKIWDDALYKFQDIAYNYTGPLFLAFVFLALVFWSIPWARWLGLYFCAAYFMGLSATYIDRLLLPYLTVACIFVALAVTSINSKRIYKTWSSLISVLVLAFNMYVFSTIFFLTSVQGLSVATGRVTPTEYLKNKHNWYADPSYSAYKAIEGLQLKSQERILDIGEARIFYSPRLTIASAPHDTPIAFSWANESQGPAALYEKFKSHDIGVILINRYETRRTNPEKYVNPRALKLIPTMLVQYFDNVYEDAWTVVYRRKDLK